MTEATDTSKILRKILEDKDVHLDPVERDASTPEVCRPFAIRWPANRQSIQTSRQELFELEKTLEREHGISEFSEVMLGGGAVVLVSGDKAVRLSRKPLQAARCSEANPVIAQGAGGAYLHYAISKYLPQKITDQRQVTALHASLYDMPKAGTFLPITTVWITIRWTAERCGWWMRMERRCRNPRMYP